MIVFADFFPSGAYIVFDMFTFICLMFFTIIVAIVAVRSSERVQPIVLEEDLLKGEEQNNGEWTKFINDLQVAINSRKTREKTTDPRLTAWDRE